MKKYIVAGTVVFFIVWVVFVFVALSEHAEGIIDAILSALFMAVACIPIIVLLILRICFGVGGSERDTREPIIRSPKPYDTGLMSCKKCGYLGVWTGGICPICGWNRTEKITRATKLISCKKGGYLGAGSGICPRCGWNRTEKLKK